jgi:hypothetical protein
MENRKRESNSLLGETTTVEIETAPAETTGNCAANLRLYSMSHMVLFGQSSKLGR